jgi:hypothetical protein
VATLRARFEGDWTLATDGLRGTASQVRRGGRTCIDGAVGRIIRR